jgi:DNA-binding beta-propeller fold protein YncE
MRRAALLFAFGLACGSVFAQRPSDPALMIPEKAPAMDYMAVPESLHVPDGVVLDAPANVGFNSKGHLFVLNRGEAALLEFDENEKFIRAFAKGMFTRTHGLFIDSGDNIWVTDVGAHVVVKFSPEGQVLLTLGTKGKAGEWSGESHLLNQPNDIAMNSDGDLFLVEGHTPGLGRGDARVLKFDREGNFIKTWGGKGTGPGQFNVAHGIAVDSHGLLWVADRENQRIQIFDADGNYIREIKVAGLPCAMEIGRDYVYMVNGFAGQLVRMDLDGKILAVVGEKGTGLGEFGEAHFLAVSPKGDIYITDSENHNVQKFVKK